MKDAYSISERFFYATRRLKHLGFNEYHPFKWHHSQAIPADFIGDLLEDYAKDSPENFGVDLNYSAAWLLPSGGGKTAFCRLMGTGLRNRRQQATEGVVDRSPYMPLEVYYNDFTWVEEHEDQRNTAIGLRDHEEHLLPRIAEAVWHLIAEDPYFQFSSVLPDERKWFWSFLAAILGKYVEGKLTAYPEWHEDFNHASPLDPPFPPRASLPTKIEMIVSHLKKTQQVDSLFILVDGLDSASDDYVVWRALLLNLLRSKLHEHARWMFFLPDTLGATVQSSQAGRTNWVIPTSYSWTDESLRMMIDKRITHFSEGDSASFEVMLDSTLSVNVLDELIQSALKDDTKGPPRELLRMLTSLFEERGERVRIGQEDWDAFLNDEKENRTTKAPHYSHEQQGEESMEEARIQAVGFLFEIGRWAATELKQRWILLRQQNPSQTVKADLTASTKEDKQTVEEFIQAAARESGAIEVKRRLAIVKEKRDLIYDWQQARISNNQAHERNRMSRAARDLDNRELTVQIRKTLQDIEGELTSLGLRVDKIDID